MFIHLYFIMLIQPLQLIWSMIFYNKQIQYFHKSITNYISITPSSIIILHALLLMWHPIWKVFFICYSNSSYLIWALNASLTINDSPSTGYSTSSSLASSIDNIFSASLSPIIFTSSWSCKIITFLLRYWEAMRLSLK